MRACKRFIDIVVSVIALIVLAPVMAVLALLVANCLGRPVLFRQTRVGKDERLFEIVKFRTMTDERDHLGNLLPDDQRLTRFGRVLRATSLDELPELVHVLCGEMSLVGPRPLLVEYLDAYTPRERQRHCVRPGLTGLAQVNGRNATTWTERLAHDIVYVDQWSLRMDLGILLATARQLVRPGDVAHDGHATMPSLLEERWQSESP